MRELEFAGILPEGRLADIAARADALFHQLSYWPEPVLLHGDPLPPNMINSLNGWALIDWDEACAGWWPYEAARLSYYVERAGLLESFWKLYPHGELGLEDFLRIVALEHVRQHLRQIFQLGFRNDEPAQLRPSATSYLARIDILLDDPIRTLQ